MPYMVIITTPDTLKKKPEMLRASIRALTRAMKFAREHPDEAKRFVRPAFAETDEAIFNEAWDNYQQTIPKTPVISRAQFEKTEAWLNITAAKPLTVRFEDSIISKIAEEAAADILGK